MNKLSSCTLFGAVGCILIMTSQAQAEMKVATIDMQKVFTAYYKTHESEDKLKEAQKAYTTVCERGKNAICCSAHCEWRLTEKRTDRPRAKSVLNGKGVDFKSRFLRQTRVRFLSRDPLDIRNKAIQLPERPQKVEAGCHAWVMRSEDFSGIASARR
jgi:hypothetical protein